VPAGEDRIREGLERLARVGDGEGAFDLVSSKKARRRVVRRMQVAGLVVAVAIGTTAGTYGLLKVFDVGGHVRPMARLSGNGDIAFVARRAGHAQIYVMHPDGTHVRRLTHDPWDHTHPSWSPDGSKLAFASDRDGAYEIYVMNADGTGVRKLTNLQADTPAWSPDGTRIAFTGNPPRGEPIQVTGLFVMDADGSNVRRITPSDGAGRQGQAVRSESAPTWSPDGRSIAFAVSVPVPCPPVSGQLCLTFFSSQIDVTNPDGTGSRLLSTATDEASTPSWSPNGRQIAVTVTIPSRARSPRIGVAVIKANGGALRLLTTGGPVRNSQPQWSPDGQQIVFVSNREGNDDIFVMNADGTGARRLTQDPSNDGQPAWQPVASGPPAEPNESPTGTPNENPSPSEPPSGSPGEPPFVGYTCGGSAVAGDFDGDGLLDAAVVHPTGAIFQDQPMPCPTPLPGYAQREAFSLTVAWGSGAQGSWDLPECVRACEAYAGDDIDGNGTDEFALIVDEGASTKFLEFLELVPSEAGPILFEVVPPGTEAHPSDQPLEAGIFGSVTHQDFVTCQTAGDASPQLITTAAQVSQDQTTWNLAETVFGFDGSAKINDHSARTALAFTVVSTRDYTEPFDPNGNPPTVSGDPCFVSG